MLKLNIKQSLKSPNSGSSDLRSYVSNICDINQLVKVAPLDQNYFFWFMKEILLRWRSDFVVIPNWVQLCFFTMQPYIWSSGEEDHSYPKYHPKPSKIDWSNVQWLNQLPKGLLPSHKCTPKWCLPSNWERGDHM